MGKKTNSLQIGILTDADKNFLTKVAIGGGGALCVYVVYRKIANYLQDQKEEKFAEQASSYGTAENFASKLKEGFDYFSFFGGNTDKALVLQTLREIPNRAMWLKVQAAFKNRYEKNLYDELTAEFGDSSIGGSMREVEAITKNYR